MKILYVEDELKKNVSGIIDLFKKYLNEEIIMRLETLMTDDFASNQDVKELVEESGFIEVAYKFPEAIRLVKENYTDYSLFIVDCNLSEQPYKVDELKAVAPEYDDEKKERYNQREGEFLVNILTAKKEIVEEIKDKFYFLSAYSPSQNILGLIDNGTLSKQNYIEKGCSEAKKDLISKIINRNKNLEARLNNKIYIDILSEIDVNLRANLIQLIINKDEKEHIKANMQFIRVISEKLYNKIVESLSDKPEEIYTDISKRQLSIGGFIRWINENRDKFKTNSILKNHMYSIQSVCSGVIHDSLEGFQPTTDTVNSLVYALKDVISWYSSIKDLD